MPCGPIGIAEPSQAGRRSGGSGGPLSLSLRYMVRPHRPMPSRGAEPTRLSDRSAQSLRGVVTGLWAADHLPGGDQAQFDSHLTKAGDRKFADVPTGMGYGDRARELFASRLSDLL